MNTLAGLWIDHREAVIVMLSDNEAKVTEVKSQVEKQLRRAGEQAKGHFSALEVPPDDSREREYQGDLARYYDNVISHLRTADEILIFGPGEAKGEFKKRVEKDKNGSLILKLETTDKMTEPQIVAHVRQHFQSPAPRVAANRRASPILNQI